MLFILLDPGCFLCFLANYVFDVGGSFAVPDRNWCMCCMLFLNIHFDN